MKIFPLFLCLLFPFVSLAQSPKEVKSDITHATVYTNSAEIKRNASVTLKAGQNILHFTGLSSFANIDQLRVKSSQPLTVSSFSALNDYLLPTSHSTDVLALKKRLDDAELRLGVRKGTRDAYEQEKQLITSNKSILGEGDLDVMDLTELANLYRSRIKEINIKLLEITAEEKELAKEVQNLKKQVQQAGGTTERFHKTFELIVMSEKGGNYSLELSYFVYNVTWQPEYDIVVDEGSGNLKFTYKAKIHQRTDVSWDNIKLSVNSGTPTGMNSKPELQPHYLDFTAQKEKEAYVSIRGARSAAPQAMSADVQEVNWKNAKPAIANNRSGLINEFYDLSNTYSLPGNGKPFSVTLKESTAASSIKYYAVPSRTRTTFLVAEIPSAQLNGLLPGKANCYSNNDLIGTTYFQPNMEDEKLLLTIGNDADVVSEKNLVIDLKKDAKFAGSNKKNFEYKLTVKNNKNRAITVVLEDQLPLSKNTDISVDIGTISEATHDKETGKLKWELNLGPQEQKEVLLHYVVKYPKGQRISY